MNSVPSKAGISAPVRVLLTDTNRWALSARLAICLAEMGCHVSAICPARGHPLLKTRAVQRTFRYGGLRPLDSLRAAIEAVDPQIVIPCDDRGVQHLHELYTRAWSLGGSGDKLAALIERSLGTPANYPVVSSRYALLAIAQEEGLRVPDTCLLDAAGKLESWQSREPFPWVLKADGTWGGGGVRVAHTLEEAQQSLSLLTGMFRIGRAIKRLCVNRDPFWLRPWWNGSMPSVSVQSYINGRPANCAVVCWEGRVLAGIAVEVISADGETGPASVVRVVDSPEMMLAAERIACRLGLSGFFGLDFMIEEGSNVAYLIEMNPRCTPLSHLRIGEGRDMAGALWSQLAGHPLPEAPAATQNDLIAYFPQAWNSKSQWLQASFHDIPESEPELVQELLQPWPDRSVFFRLYCRLHQIGASATALVARKRPYGELKT